MVSRSYVGLVGLLGSIRAMKTGTSNVCSTKKPRVSLARCHLLAAQSRELDQG